MPEIMGQDAMLPQAHRTITTTNTSQSWPNPYQPIPDYVCVATITENCNSLSGAAPIRVRAPRRLSIREHPLEPKRKARKNIRNPIPQIDNQHELSSARYKTRSQQDRNNHRSNTPSLPLDYQMERDPPGFNSLQSEISPTLPPRFPTTNNHQGNEPPIGEDPPYTPSRNSSQQSSEFVTPASRIDHPHLESPSPALSPEYIPIDEAFIPRSFVPEDPFIDSDSVPYTNSEVIEMRG